MNSGIVNFFGRPAAPGRLTELYSSAFSRNVFVVMTFRLTSRKCGRGNDSRTCRRKEKHLHAPLCKSLTRLGILLGPATIHRNGLSNEECLRTCDGRSCYCGPSVRPT